MALANCEALGTRPALWALFGDAGSRVESLGVWDCGCGASGAASRGSGEGLEAALKWIEVWRERDGGYTSRNLREIAGASSFGSLAPNSSINAWLMLRTASDELLCDFSVRRQAWQT